MSDDFLRLFNGALDQARTIASPNNSAESLDTKLEDLNLDSLDYLMLGAYIGDLYGVPEEASKQIDVSKITTVGDYMGAIMERKTKDIEDVDAALESIRR